jgi:hypothetical protein
MCSFKTVRKIKAQWKGCVCLSILSRDRVTIDGIWIGNRIYCTILQLVNTFHRFLSHTDYRSQSRCLVPASNNVASSASVSNGSCPRWLAPFSRSSRPERTSNCQPPNSAASQSQIQNYFRTGGLPPIGSS